MGKEYAPFYQPNPTIIDQAEDVVGNYIIKQIAEKHEMAKASPQGKIAEKNLYTWMDKFKGETKPLYKYPSRRQREDNDILW